ncbi:hypothetical protein I5B93_04235 [Staphylococcus aureus]|nr:hypothetical protein I5B93_04235 [Staphylococcus aureus]
MRYEDRVIFQLEQVATYNPKTSKKENTLITYDAIQSISYPVSHVLVNGIRYKIVDTRIYRHETSYYIEEVN